MLVPRHPPPAVETAVGCVVVNVGSGDRARTSNDLPVRTRGVPNGKVVRPPLQVPIQLPNQCQDRLKALMTVRHLVQLLPLPLDRLFRRKHIRTSCRALSDRDHTETCIPESSGSLVVSVEKLSPTPPALSPFPASPFLRLPESP